MLEPEFLNGLTWPPVENPCGVGRLRSCAWWTHKTKRPSWKKKIISLAMPGAASLSGSQLGNRVRRLQSQKKLCQVSSHPSVPLIPRLLGSEAGSWEPPDSALRAQHPQFGLSRDRLSKPCSEVKSSSASASSRPFKTRSLLILVPRPLWLPRDKAPGARPLPSR